MLAELAAQEVAVVEPDGTTYAARWRLLGEFSTSAKLAPDGQTTEASKLPNAQPPPPSKRPPLSDPLTRCSFKIAKRPAAAEMNAKTAPRTRKPGRKR
jgi:hypothetical protein